MSYSTRHLHLNLFLTGAGHHPAAWRHPSVAPQRLLQLDYVTELARLAESAKLDAIFFNDRLGNRSQQPFSLIGHFESFTLLAALAVRTQKIGLIASASTIYNQPYHVARKLASLDYLTGGRAAWSIRPSRGEDEAHNYGLDEIPSHEVRDERTREFVSVVKDLWDSWEDEAVVRGEGFKLRTDPTKVRPIDHVGTHFQVAGPLNIPRPIQGHPVLAQNYTGESEDFGASLHAELFFTQPQSLDEALLLSEKLRSRLDALERETQHTRVFAALDFTLGETTAAAQSKRAELDAFLAPSHGVARLSELLKLDLSRVPLDEPLAPPLAHAARQANGSLGDAAELAALHGVTLRDLATRLAPSRRPQGFVGTPAELADHIEDWFSSGAVDGFNLRPALLPSDLQLFAEAVVPELQRRGLFRTDYEGDTFREHLGLPRPTNGFVALAALRGITPAKPLEFV
ncbi:nitrilotriacetate monooxygenase component A [Abditibacteriota bacterium]|nr:nitrilotriacetate monooxygenase component A [Abditibacteriota bacterium]